MHKYVCSDNLILIIIHNTNTLLTFKYLKTSYRSNHDVHVSKFSFDIIPILNVLALAQKNLKFMQR